jgi:hypothetical protein
VTFSPPTAPLLLVLLAGGSNVLRDFVLLPLMHLL